MPLPTDSAEVLPLWQCDHSLDVDCLVCGMSHPCRCRIVTVSSRGGVFCPSRTDTGRGQPILL